MSSGGDSGRLAQGGTGGVKVVVGIRLGCPMSDVRAILDPYQRSVGGRCEPFVVLGMLLSRLWSLDARPFTFSSTRPHTIPPSHFRTSSRTCHALTFLHVHIRVPHVSFARHPRSVVRSRTRPRVVPCPLFTPALSALFLASRLRSMRARSSSRVHYCSGSVHRGDAVSLALLDFPFLSSPLVVPIPMLVTSIRYARDQGW